MKHLFRQGIQVSIRRPHWSRAHISPSTYSKFTNEIYHATITPPISPWSFRNNGNKGWTSATPSYTWLRNGRRLRMHHLGKISQNRRDFDYWHETRLGQVHGHLWGCWYTRAVFMWVSVADRESDFRWSPFPGSYLLVITSRSEAGSREFLSYSR